MNKKLVRVLSGTSLEKYFVVSIPENPEEKQKVLAKDDGCCKYIVEKKIFHPMYMDDLKNIYLNEGTAEILWDEENNSPELNNGKIVFLY